MNPSSFLPSPLPFQIDRDTGQVIINPNPISMVNNNNDIFTKDAILKFANPTTTTTSNSSSINQQDRARILFPKVLDALLAAKFEIATLIQALEATDGKRAVLATERVERTIQDKQHEKASQRVTRAKKLQRLDDIVNVLDKAHMQLNEQVIQHRQFLNELWTLKQEWRLVGVPRMVGTRQAWIESHEPLLFDITGGIPFAGNIAVERFVKVNMATNNNNTTSVKSMDDSLPILGDDLLLNSNNNSLKKFTTAGQVELISSSSSATTTTTTTTTSSMEDECTLMNLVASLFERKKINSEESNNTNDILIERCVWYGGDELFTSTSTPTTPMTPYGNSTSNTKYNAHDDLQARLIDARAKSVFSMLFPGSSEKQGILLLSPQYKMQITLEPQSSTTVSMMLFESPRQPPIVCHALWLNVSYNAIVSNSYLMSREEYFQHLIQACQHALFVPMVREGLNKLTSSGIESLNWWSDSNGISSSCRIVLWKTSAMQFDIVGNVIKLAWCSVKDGRILESLSSLNNNHTSPTNKHITTFKDIIDNNPDFKQDDQIEHVLRRFQYQEWTSTGSYHTNNNNNEYNEEQEVNDCVAFTHHMIRVVLKQRLEEMLRQISYQQQQQQQQEHNQQQHFMLSSDSLSKYYGFTIHNVKIPGHAKSIQNTIFVYVKSSNHLICTFKHINQSASTTDNEHDDKQESVIVHVQTDPFEYLRKITSGNYF
jgi:hypothetical protein